MLKLERRDGTIGNAIQTRGEEHGDETLPAKDIPLTIMVSRPELGQILREPLAGESFFNVTADFAEPLYGGKIAPIKILGKFEDSTVVITVGIDETEIRLTKATLASMSFDPTAGGMSILKLQVQYHPQDSDNVQLLEKWLNHDCKIEIEIGQLAKPKKTDQQQLPLGDPTEASDDAPESLGDAIDEDEAEQQAAELLAADKTPAKRSRAKSANKNAH